VDLAIDLAEALLDLLKENDRSVTTEYDLYGLLHQLYGKTSYKGKPLRTKKKRPSRHDVQAVIERLQGHDYVEIDPDFGEYSGVFRIPAVAVHAAEETCCFLDPFCYLSHASAMHHHGLVSASPELCLTTPERKIWNTLRDEREARDRAQYKNPEGEVNLRQIAFPPKVRGVKVQRHESVFPTTWQATKTIRVATLGQTFVDMLLRPNWCGGIKAVLAVWERTAAQYLEDIIPAIETAPKKLIKVRAGYILDERLGIRHEKIEGWQQFAQRGGSQVLNPDKPYTAPFSEKWMLSINL